MKNINIHNLIIEKSTNNIGAFSSYTNKNKEVMEYFNNRLYIKGVSGFSGHPLRFLSTFAGRKRRLACRESIFLP